MRVLRPRLLLPCVLVVAGCADLLGPRHGPLVALVFDDNAAGVAELAFPLMSDRRMVGTVFVHTCSIGQPSYMGFDQLKRLQRAGWEIGAHTLTHADLTRLTPEQVRFEAAGSRAVLEANGFACSSFAIPYGHVNADIRGVLEELFDVVRDSHDRVLRRPINWHLIGMYALHQGEAPSAAMGRLDRAVRRSEDVVILGFHGISSGALPPALSYPCYDVKDLEAILDYVQRMSLRTVTLAEARELLG